MIYVASELEGAVCETAASERPTLAAIAEATGQPPQGVLDEDWCSTRAGGRGTLDSELLFVDLGSQQTILALRDTPSIAQIAQDRVDERIAELQLSLHREVERSGPTVANSDHVQDLLRELEVAVSALRARGGHNDIDAVLLRGDDRRFTQEVARYIYEQSATGGPGLTGQPGGAIVAGVRYLSRHGDEAIDYVCWAVYDTRLAYTSLDEIPLTIKGNSDVAQSVRAAATHLGLKIDDS